MKRNSNGEEIAKKTDDEGNGVDEQLYDPCIDLSFEDEENISEESDGSDLSSGSGGRRWRWKNQKERKLRVVKSFGYLKRIRCVLTVSRRWR
jgi:hypothetical protein